MRLCQCILLAAIVLEASSWIIEPAVGQDQVSASATEGQAKSPRLIKRIIRARESDSPPPDGQEPSSGAPVSTPSAISNNVDVNPEISVQVPNAQGGPQVSGEGQLPQNMRSSNKKVNKVPYKPRHRHNSPQTTENHVEPIIEEPGEDEDPHDVGQEHKDNPDYGSRQLQIEPYQLPPSTNGQQAQPNKQRDISLIGNSGNQRNTMLNNVGNTETIQMEGVGNKKVTKISDIGNNLMEEHDNDRPPGDSDNKRHRHHDNCKHRREKVSSGVATGGAPLVQVNIGQQEGLPARQAQSSYLVPIVSDSALIDVRSAKLMPKSDLSKLVAEQPNRPQSAWPSAPGLQYMLVQQQPQQQQRQQYIEGLNPQQPLQLGSVYQFASGPMTMPPAYPMYPTWPMWPTYPMPPYPMGPPSRPPFFDDMMMREPSFFRGPRRGRRHRRKRNKDGKKRHNKVEPVEEQTSTTPAPMPAPEPEAEAEPSTETSTQPTVSTTPKAVVGSRLEQLKSWLPEISIRETPGKPAEKPKEEIEWETIRVPKIKKNP